MTTHMDAYTILYQAKTQMHSASRIRKMVEEKTGENAELFLTDMNEDVLRRIALLGLEEGINQIRYEYPPNVSKRMQTYYHQNRDFLIDAFSKDVKEVMIHEV